MRFNKIKSDKCQRFDPFYFWVGRSYTATVTNAPWWVDIHTEVATSMEHRKLITDEFKQCLI